MTVALRVLSPLQRGTNFEACDKHVTVKRRNVLRSELTLILIELIVIYEKINPQIIVHAVIYAYILQVLAE